MVEKTTQLAVRPLPEVTAEGLVPQIVLDGRWRIIRERPYQGPHDRPRSVVLPAALLSLAICGAPFLPFVLAVVVSR